MILFLFDPFGLNMPNHVLAERFMHTMDSDAAQHHRITILRSDPKPLSGRAENAPLATHSDDLKGGVHELVFP